jgi:hypothetical protein
MFRSKAGRAVGGAERSMLRLIRATHPDRLDCHVVLDSMANQALYDLFNNAGIPIHIARGPFQLYNCLKQVQPDIAYLFARIHVGAGWATVARLARVSVILGAERGWGGGLTDRISQQMGKFFMDGYITNSRSASIYLRKAGISNDRIFVVYNGIAENENQIRNWFPKGRLVLLALYALLTFYL